VEKKEEESEYYDEEEDKDNMLLTQGSKGVGHVLHVDDSNFR
jgi:hypothetical protein